MSRYISTALRQLVLERASFRCEYCHIHQDDYFYQFEVDHIVSIRHEGETSLDNLACACSACNRNKAADLGTYLDRKMDFVRLFNPRMDRWETHFEHENGEILPLTPIGRATVKLLDLNAPDRIILRRVLISVGRYP